MHTDVLGVGGLVVWYLSVFICVCLCSFFSPLNLLTNRDIFDESNTVQGDAHRWTLMIFRLYLCHEMV